MPDSIYIEVDNNIMDSLERLLELSMVSPVFVAGTTDCDINKGVITSIRRTNEAGILRYYHPRVVDHVLMTLVIDDEASIGQIDPDGLMRALLNNRLITVCYEDNVELEFCYSAEDETVKINTKSFGWKERAYPVMVFESNPKLLVDWIQLAYERQNEWRKETWVRLGGQDGFLAYKRLYVRFDVPHSPIRRSRWVNNELTVTHELNERNPGIFSMKSPIHTQLICYTGEYFEIFVPHEGTIITSYGYRSRYAKIIRMIPHEEIRMLRRLEERIVAERVADIMQGYGPFYVEDY